MFNEYIFIIDLDNTIIGNCIYQCELYYLYCILKNKKENIKHIDEVLYKSYKEKSKLVRPYFSKFIHKMKNKYNNASFFVYTASEKEWAIKQINMIEKNLNIVFDKPLFTRDNCILNSEGSYNKSIKKIMPQIINSLKKNKRSIENISDRLLIIDNYNTYIDYNNNLLISPSYNYILFYNLWDVIKKEYLKINNVILHIKKNIKCNLIYYTNILKYDNYNLKKIKNIYKWLYFKSININKHNKTQEKDIFWKKILYILYDIKNINKINSNTIKKIKQLL